MSVSMNLSFCASVLLWYIVTSLCVCPIRSENTPDEYASSPEEVAFESEEKQRWPTTDDFSQENKDKYRIPPQTHPLAPHIIQLENLLQRAFSNPIYRFPSEVNDEIYNYVRQGKEPPTHPLYYQSATVRNSPESQEFIVPPPIVLGKRKKAQYMDYVCHFKVCNFGRKRKGVSGPVSYNF